ncbi:MAG: hypothetical protein MZV64_52970 [Ignavibacteriales bacterium]|nr:hypothetical protein [Ignavibacteriales bacterium]
MAPISAPCLIKDAASGKAIKAGMRTTEPKTAARMIPWKPASGPIVLRTCSEGRKGQDETDRPDDRDDGRSQGQERPSEKPKGRASLVPAFRPGQDKPHPRNAPDHCGKVIRQLSLGS